MRPAADPAAQLWERYTVALWRFAVEQSPEREGALVAAYAEWARALLAPGEAAALITALCGNLDAHAARRRAA